MCQLCPASKSERQLKSGPDKAVITKGVFSLEKFLESLKSLESLGNGPILLFFPQSGGSLESRNSLDSKFPWASFCRPISARPLDIHALGCIQACPTLLSDAAPEGETFVLASDKKIRFIHM